MSVTCEDVSTSSNIANSSCRVSPKEPPAKANLKSAAVFDTETKVPAEL